MTNAYLNPDDQPALRARIPAHVASGQISTGVIIVTGPMEFLLDFVRSLPRPNAIVSRIVLPHGVMPQFIQALEKNLELYRNRFGAIAGEGQASVGLISRDFSGRPIPPGDVSAQVADGPGTTPQSPELAANLPDEAASANSPHVPASGLHAPRPTASDFGRPIDVLPGASIGPNSQPPVDPAHHVHHAHPDQGALESKPPRSQNPQEIYDELKLRDELLSGAYANAVMIGHGQYEFSFDFITNFYPQSAVSARVFMAAGHVPRLLESLKASWEQLRPRLQGGGGFE